MWLCCSGWLKLAGVSTCSAVPPSCSCPSKSNRGEPCTQQHTRSGTFCPQSNCRRTSETDSKPNLFCSCEQFLSCGAVNSYSVSPFKRENNSHVVCSHREVGVVCRSAISTSPTGDDLLLVHSNAKHATSRTPAHFTFSMI